MQEIIIPHSHHKRSDPLISTEALQLNFVRTGPSPKIVCGTAAVDSNTPCITESTKLIKPFC